MIKDFSGSRFGKLLIVSFNKRTKNIYKWNCICDCGKKVIVDIGDLKRGHTKSCGCLHKKLNGLCNSREYHSWRSMVYRCHYKDSISYKNYGAKGIKVCNRWRTSFLNFLEDMGKRPDGTTLDRIDTSGNYCKDNCRWATWKQQGRNRSNNHIIEAFGKKQTLTGWAEEFGLSRVTIMVRLKLGWPIELALSKKIRGN